MGKDVKAFLKTKREKTPYRPVCERIKDYQEVVLPRPDEKSQEQASRCMDCGTPFCHWGCPVGNYIPEWNDAVISGHWEKALKLLWATNNLPEITGRVCPAPCEYACVLGINDDAVTIRENEFSIIEYGFKHRLVKPHPPGIRTGKKVAVIGSGPAGLSCAAQLNQAGHSVTVYERDAKCGGILRYGIPDFKLEKHILDRRLKIWEAEGVQFETNTDIGNNIDPKTLSETYDAVCIATGSRVPRDLDIPGRNLNGIHFAMDYLMQNNRRVDNVAIPEKDSITARGKKVVVIGGGDTGSDCVGTANRQGARCVVQIELLPQPPECRTETDPWPAYPMLLKTSSSHEEGSQRRWSVLTKEFSGENGKVKKIECVEVEFKKDPTPGVCPVMRQIEGSEFEIETDLIILAIGFLHPQQELLDKLELKKDKRKNALTDDTFMTSNRGVFACGDARRGQSLIVWAIAEGRRTAHHIDRYLMGESNLPMV